jgi:hypothetical protein
VQWTSRLVALGLALGLLLASPAGLVDHDHGPSVELAGFACAADHDSAGRHEASAGRGAHAAGEEHQHTCPGCHPNGQRLLLAASQGLATGWTRATATPRPVLRPGTPADWAHPPRRGPPT